MEIWKKGSDPALTDRVIVFYNDQGEGRTCHVSDVLEVTDGRIITTDRRFVLPLSDASIYTSASGLVYAYNVNLPYLQEIEHLADVEENIIVSQAFDYAGRTPKATGTSGFAWAVTIMLGVIVLIQSL